MPIYRLSDGREANVGPENESRFLEDFADFNPEVIEEDIAADIDVEEVTVEDEKKEIAIAPMGASVVAQDDMASSLEKVSLDLPEDKVEDTDIFSYSTPENKVISAENNSNREKEKQKFLEETQDIDVDDDEKDALYDQIEHQNFVDDKEAFTQKSQNRVDRFFQNADAYLRKALEDNPNAYLTIKEALDAKILPYVDPFIAYEKEDGEIVISASNTTRIGPDEYFTRPEEDQARFISIYDYAKKMATTFSDMINFAGNAWDDASTFQGGLTLRDEGAEMSQEDFEKYQKAIKEAENNPLPESVLRFQAVIESEENGFKGFFKALLDQPTVAPAYVANLLTLLGGAYLQSEDIAGPVTGAAAAEYTRGFLSTPGDVRVKLVAGIPYGVRAGMATLSSKVAGASKFNEILRSEFAPGGLMEGQEFNFQNVMSLVESEDWLKRARVKSKTYGISIGAVDYFTGGLTGKVIKRYSTAGKIKTATIAGSTVEGTGGAFGELLGQVLEGSIDYDEELGVYTQDGQPLHINEFGQMGYQVYDDSETFGIKIPDTFGMFGDNLRFVPANGLENINGAEIAMELVFGPAAGAPNVAAALVGKHGFTYKGETYNAAQVPELIKTLKPSEAMDMALNMEFTSKMPASWANNIRKQLYIKGIEGRVSSKITNPETRKQIAKVEFEIQLLRQKVKQDGLESDKIELKEKENELVNLYQEGVQGVDRVISPKVEAELEEERLAVDRVITKNRVDRSIEFAKNSGLKPAENVIVLPENEAIDAIAEAIAEKKGITKQEAMAEAEETVGEVFGDKMIINYDKAVKDKAITIGEHEVGHWVLDEIGIDDTRMKSIVKKFKSVLSQSALRKLEAEYNTRYAKDGDTVSAQEWFTVFIDLVGQGKIDLDDANPSDWQTIANEDIGQIFTETGLKGYRFDTGNQAYEFIAAYWKKAQTGRLREGGFSSKLGLFKPKVKVQTTDKEKKFRPDRRSKDQVEEDVNDLVFGLDQETYFEEFDNIYSTIVQRGDFDNLISANDNISKNQKQKEEFIKDVLANMTGYIRNFDPTTNDNFFAYINSQIKNRSALIANRRLKEIETEQQSVSLDDEAAFVREIADEPTTTTTVEADEAPSLLDKLPVNANIRLALKNSVKSALNKIGVNFGEGKKLTRTVSPFISLFKKELGDAPRGKKGISNFAAEIRNSIKKDYEGYLTTNMNRILKNAPLDWLANNFPSMVEKQVNGVFTADWKGKKIDREKSAETGNTAGPQIKRRRKGVTVDLETFLNHYLNARDAKGKRKPKQMRVESLVKMLAQEFGLEYLSAELNKPNSELSKQVDQIANLRDVVLAENFAAELKRDLERGSVKKYRSAGKDFGQILLYAPEITQSAIKNGYRSPKFDDELRNLGVDPDSSTLEEIMFWLGWFDEGQAFKKPIREGLEKGEYKYFKKQIDKYLEDTISTDIAKDQLAIFLGKLLKRYPSELLKVMKSRNDNFDLKSSSRLLDGRENGRLKDFKLRQAIEERTQGNFGNVDELNFDITKIRLVNAGKGIANRIETFLEQDFNSREEKIKAFNEKFKQEIEDLNANNHGFIEFNVIEMIELVVQNKDNLIGVLRHLEGASGNTSGFLRAYSRISLVEIFAKNQKADKNHPLYNEAVKFIKKYNPEITDPKDIEAAAEKLLRQKGEHVMASSNLAKSIFDIIAEAAELIIENPSEKQNILNNVKADLADKMYNYDQVLGSKVMFDIIDKRPRGSTDPAEYIRFDDVKDNLPNYYNPITGQDGVQTQAQRIDSKVDLALAKIKDRVEYQKKFRAVNNSNDGGATIFDFDDTVATSNSQVIVIKKDGTQYTITPAEFAKKGERLLLEGNEFDFSQFNDVIDGKPGPFFEKLKKRIEKFGNENVYILTARPKESQLAILEWLRSNGIYLKQENITGLGNSTALAKAEFVVGLVQEKGLTNVHFADDAVNNVETMDILLSQIEGLKSTSTLVVESKKYRSKKVNQILEATTGIREEMTFSDVVARQKGKEKDKFRFLPYSAEDFKGLIYQLCGRDEQGVKDFAFFKRELLDPFAKGINLINSEKQAIMNDYRALRKAMPEVRKKLGKKIPNTEFTFGMAIRVYLSDKAGFDVPGISKRDLNKIKSVVKNDPELLKFANTLGLISRKEEGYIELKQDWLGGSISSDLSDISVKINRKEFLKDFITAKDEIFTDQFKAKLRAAYGNKYVEALDDLLYRMETGARRNFGSNRIVNAWTNWVNNSVGAIMFFNARSAVLQTLSTVNFINWSDNNLFKAAKAFANQPQYWKDFTFLFNSDFLKQRRAGLQTDVNQAELASAAMAAPNKAKAVLAYLLKKGFLPTQIADSFAIASGGATFYRNKINKYVKEGMSQAEAEKQAFIDFQEVAEETQQSSSPDKISPQQASALGRWILAFQNTPMQYTRLIYRAGQDLANNRGSKVENISKIIYYGAMQNLIFASLQSALFAFAFDDEIDEDEQARLEQKQIRIVNNMVDSILRGTGITGAAIATIKNTIMEFYKQEQKKFNNDHAQTLIQFANLAPPVGIKFRKIYSGIQSYTYNKDIVGEMSYLDPQNPGVQAVANVISGATNFPTDRIVNKTNNLVEVLNSDNENWQRLALTLGWNTWDVGVEQTRRDEAKLEVKRKKKEEKKKNQQRCTQIKSNGERCKMMVDKPKKKCHYHD